MRRITVLAAFLIAVGGGSAASKSEFAQKMESDYDILSQDLMNHAGELATVENFVYTKDVATFTFKEGIIYLLRYVDDRPTTAIFIGKGNARIEIPSHVERQSLYSVSRDSVVNEDFETCFIRFADDFDLKLKERFATDTTQLKWKHFNQGAKKSQGEIFFRPTLHHLYDSYFQLLRSIYQRAADGFFWVDFNRYVFRFDPSRPEEVTVAYEYQGGDVAATDAAVFQRRERNVYDDTLMSDILYPTTILDREADIEMTGLDGKYLEGAETTIQVEVDRDSLRFMSLFLDPNLKTDSIYYDGQPVDYHRRKDFSFIGIVLPMYRHRGDTVTLTLWYRGKQFDQTMPWVENPQVSSYNMTFVTPKDFNYFMPGMGEVTPLDGGKQTFPVRPQNMYNKFYFQGFASGIDTVPVPTNLGISLNFINWELMDKKYSECYIPQDMYEEITTEAFDYMASQFGPPMGAFSMFVSPAGTYSMPGIMCVPQIACVTEGAATRWAVFAPWRDVRRRGSGSGR